MSEQAQDYLVFDLETKYDAASVGGWSNLGAMGMSVGVVWDSRENKYFVYLEDKVDDLIEHLCSGPRLVGYNHVNFDLPVLLGYRSDEIEKEALRDRFMALQNFDLLIDIKQRIGFRIKLDSIARMTLKTSKSADGLKALEWYREFEKTGDPAYIKKIAEYCVMDVQVTKNVYLFGLENGYIYYESKTGETKMQEVDWVTTNSMLNIRGKETEQLQLI